MGVYRFSNLPTNVEEFKKLPYYDLTNPHNTFAMFIVALGMFIKDKAAGTECINLLRGPEPLSNYDMSFLNERVADKPYFANVYFEGASPSNNYTPLEPLSIKTIEDSAPQYTAGENYKRVFIKEDGFDNIRYATFRLKPSTGCWYLSDYSGILVGVKTPVEANPWA